MFSILRQNIYFKRVPTLPTIKSTHILLSSSVKCNQVSILKPPPCLEEQLVPFKVAVQEQGNVVKKLKESRASMDTLNKAVASLKAMKHLLEQKVLELWPPLDKVDKEKLDDLLKQRFFYDQSFAIYGGLQGLYDFGPMGCAVKANLLQEWRRFFILADRMLEVDCPVLTPEAVLKASGHVDRFTDYLVSDSVTGESFRADHLARRWLENLLTDPKTSAERRQQATKALGSVDSLDGNGLQGVIDGFGIASPTTGNPLTPPRRFNLMLETSVGAPTSPHRVYLRPETAQGIFVNFRRLLDVNRGQLPMAVAQVGRSFRNEIAPRSGLLRLREFTLAEIEHFYDPADSRHPSFASVADATLPLLSATDQAAGRDQATWRRLDTALASSGGPIANETLAYYLARVYAFLTCRCGIDPRRLRFRQHPPGEMAHYASDCWDAECLLASGGWVECVGCADRSAYDLTRHAEASGARLVAETADADDGDIAVDAAALVATFGQAGASEVSAYLATLPLSELRHLARASGEVVRQIDGQKRCLLPGMVSLKSTPQQRRGQQRTREVVPCVVEPSFGIGRIITAALEHNFRIRGSGVDSDGGRRTYLSLPARLAPYACVLLPMRAASAAMSDIVCRLSAGLTLAGLSHSIDATPGASIGKRYARNDQIGVPFAVTVDFDSVAGDVSTAAAGSPATVTLRERDSMSQVRVEVNKVPELIQQLVQDRITWQQVMAAHPVFHQQTVTRETAASL